MAAPFHKTPPGRQKSEREFCLFGGVFLRPACRAMWRAGHLCTACRCCALLARLSRPFCCPVSFSAGAVCAGLLLPLFGLLGLLRRGQGGAAARQLCVRFPAGAPAFCGVVSRPACLIAAFALCLPCALCVRGFSLLSFAFFCLTFASQISFHLSLRPRRASTFFRKESRQRFARSFAPSNPIPAPCGRSFLLPRCWPAYAALRPQTAG